MRQVNRYIKDNPALDDVDHALGRPYKPHDTYRNHYATDCPDKIAEFEKSDWWNVVKERNGMTYCYVSDAGRKALADELAKPEYGRLFSITSRRHAGETFVMAGSHSQAKYRAFINADLDWSFMDYCKEISVRLAV